MTRIAAAILTLAALTIAPCSADRVTTDPNTASARAAQVDTSDVDARLAQKITYDSGYKRLHYMLEEISAKTGVTVRCGSSKNDWPVRDMPLAISVHELPLGKLLEAIASAADLDLTSEKIATDNGAGQKVYRLSFSMRSRVALDNYVNSRHQTTVDMCDQLWDALVASADIPDSDIDLGNSDRAKSARAMAEVLKELGPDAKARAFAGETITLHTGSFSKPDLLRKWYQAEFDQSKQYNKEGAPPTGEQLDAATFSIIPTTNPTTGEFRIGMSVPVRYDMSTISRTADLRQTTRDIWQRTKGHKSPSVLRARLPAYTPPPDHMARDLAAIRIDANDNQPPAFLAEKVKLDLPKDKDVSYAEALAALARATGLTIVTEDYLDHKHKCNLSQQPSDHRLYTGLGQQMPTNLPPFSPVGTVSEDATVGDFLRALTKGRYGSKQFEWFYNEQAKLLVGRSPDWMRRAPRT